MFIGRTLAAGAVLLAVLSAGPAQERRRPLEGDLKVGDAAPPFTVKDMDGKKTVKLADLKGKPVVLVFGSCT